MKKLLGIVVLGLLWCNVGYSLDEPSCQSTNYVSPCTCKYSDGWGGFEEFQCIYKKKKALKPKKISRSQASAFCAQKAEEYNKELSVEIYKDCMKDKGFR